MHKLEIFFIDLTWQENKAISECTLITNLRRLRFLVLVRLATNICTVTQN